MDECIEKVFLKRCIEIIEEAGEELDRMIFMYGGGRRPVFSIGIWAVIMSEIHDMLSRFTLRFFTKDNKMSGELAFVMRLEALSLKDKIFELYKYEERESE